MEYYIAVFTSRTEALSFANLLSRNGIYSSVIPTPKEAGKTCGLSVRLKQDDYKNAKFLLSRTRNSSFLGWLYVFNKNGEFVFVRV